MILFAFAAERLLTPSLLVLVAIGCGKALLAPWHAAEMRRFRCERRRRW